MTQRDHILLAHGGGGQLTAELIAEVILPAIGGQDATALTDAAEVAWGADRVVLLAAGPRGDAAAGRRSEVSFAFLLAALVVLTLEAIVAVRE